jgi:hypothetical protein
MDIDELVTEIEAISMDTSWTQDEQYSVFAQPDRDYYESQRSRFEHKYRTFRAVSMVLRPEVIVELGTHCGSGADAYLSGVDYGAHYIGYDSFGVSEVEGFGVYDPQKRCRDMFGVRGYDDFNLITCDLRDMRTTPKADLFCVDAGNDYRNAYQDLLLALRSGSRWIHVDDYYGDDLRLAIRDITMNYADHFIGMAEINQWNGSLLLEVRQ